MRKLLVLTGLALLLSVPAWADDEEEDSSKDLSQSISDLSSQADDKEKMDSLGSSKVELSQIRGWISDATNAIKEEAGQKARRAFELVRAQLKLIDQLIALSKAEDEANKLEQQVNAAKQKTAAAQKTLQDKQAKLRALKMMQGK